LGFIPKLESNGLYGSSKMGISEKTDFENVASKNIP
jgi:hypothetical protein